MSTDEIEAEHFPWHYTSFGVSCVCGLPIIADDDCAEAARLRAPTPGPEEESK